MDVVEEGNVNHEMNHAQYMEISEIQSFELKRDDVKFERLLGSGNFGEVYKAKMGNDKVAVKSLKGNTCYVFLAPYMIPAEKAIFLVTRAARLLVISVIVIFIVIINMECLIIIFFGTSIFGPFRQVISNSLVSV